MWERYRKTWIPTQSLILVICAFLFFKLNQHWLQILVYFGAMQVWAIAGAAWAARLKRKFDRKPNPFPDLMK